MKRYKKTENSCGQLYIVPTPIGNLSDITNRALTVLRNVDLIATESVRRTSFLLKHFDVNARFFTLNVHNEQSKSMILVSRIRNGESIALVSDSGTPLINDPGYYLVRTCHQLGIRVVPLPGPCAAITALIGSGLPSHKFCYEGFLPSKSKKRRDVLKSLETESRTLIFYESTHRLLNSLNDMIDIWGGSRYVVLVRELTKTWETIYGAPIERLLLWIKEDSNRYRGEIILLIKGKRVDKNILSTEVLRTFSLLQDELPFKKAVKITSKIHGVKKNEIYRYTLEK